MDYPGVSGARAVYGYRREVQEVEIHLSVLLAAAAKPKSAYRNYGDVKRGLLRGWVKTLS